MRKNCDVWQGIEREPQPRICGSDLPGCGPLVSFETSVGKTLEPGGVIDADVEARKAEIKRLTELNKADEKKKDHLKDTLSASMNMTGHERVDTPLFKVSFRKSQAVEVDETVLPEAYKVATWKPDKKRLKEDLKNGLEIIGASLVERKNLSIR